jgi:hypothetical protein
VFGGLAMAGVFLLIAAAGAAACSVSRRRTQRTATLERARMNWASCSSAQVWAQRSCQPPGYFLVTSCRGSLSPTAQSQMAAAQYFERKANAQRYYPFRWFTISWSADPQLGCWLLFSAEKEKLRPGEPGLLESAWRGGLGGHPPSSALLFN